MLEALAETAIEDALGNGTVINHVAAFKAKVRERLEDNERSHTGYIALSYRQLEKRRALSVNAQAAPGAYQAFQPGLDVNPNRASREDAQRWARVHAFMLDHSRGPLLGDEKDTPKHTIFAIVAEVCSQQMTNDEALQVLAYLEACVDDFETKERAATILAEDKEIVP